MAEQDPSQEEIMLLAVKKALTRIIKDTATPPGMIHPLKDETLRELRDCLLLISEREQELAREAGRVVSERPRFTDEPRARDNVVIPLESSGLMKKKPKTPDS